MRKIISLLIFVLFAFGVILAVFLPIAKTYYDIYPPIGNDFYHSFNLINFYRHDLTWPHLSWRYIWHFGGPSIITYPWLNFYLVQPLVKILGIYQGTMFYFLGSLFLYAFVASFLFYRLSKSSLLSAGLAASLLWSASTWQLIAAGSLALTANQFFLALALLLIVVYLQNKNKKYLFLSALISGLSVWSQVGSAFPFIIPTILIFILFWWPEEEKFWQLKKKIGDLFLYFLTTLSVASFYTYYTLTHILGARADFDVFESMRTEAFSSIYTKSNPSLFFLIIIFLLVLIIARKFSALKKTLPFLVVGLYLLFFNFSSIHGFNPFSSSLPPAENRHIFTFIIALLVAVLWCGISPFLQKYLKKWLLYLILLASFIALLMPAGFLQTKDFLARFEKTNFVCGVPDDSIHRAMVKGDFSGLHQALPAWFKKDDLNWRFFSLAWCVDLWWNSIYKMPLNSGYDLLLITKNIDNYLNWTNDVFSGTMAKKNFEASIVKNNMLFHIDWQAGRYIERIADDLTYLEDPEIVKLDNQPKGYRTFEFRNDITSPIVRPTNVPAVLIISSQEGYDTILRVLAQENLNSRFLIPVKGTPYIDDLVKENIDDFEAVILYNYQYKNEKGFRYYPQKPWDRLASYVKNGGLLIIETGSEVKESDISNLPGIKDLPEIFPVSVTSRKELGTAWQLSRQESELLDGVDEEKFSPLDYNGLPWKLSVGERNGVRSWGKVVLSQKDKPILVWGKLGKGQVIWSGMTLPYHIQTYHNLAESKLFRNMFEKTINMKEEAVLPFDFERNKSEHIKIMAKNFDGVLFKENFNLGWQAKINKQKLKIYSAGFGFMYIKIPNSLANNSGIVVNIDYKGDPKFKMMFYISLTTIIFIIIYLFIGHKINFGRVLKLKKIINWWSKEDEL